MSVAAFVDEDGIEDDVAEENEERASDLRRRATNSGPLVMCAEKSEL